MTSEQECSRSRSKIDLHEEFDRSESEVDTDSECFSETDEETENIKEVKEHFIIDFKELQSYLDITAVCSLCHSPLSNTQLRGCKSVARAT